MSQTSYSRYKYIPDEINEKDFLAKFVIRNDIYDDIFDDIKNADFNVANQHYMIVGQRGQGKTSLLRRISIAIKNDKILSKFLIPVKFTEEQYQIRSLCRFFEVIAEELQESNSEIFPDILDDMESHIYDKDYDSKCFEYFENKVKAKEVKLIILSDNIDELLGKLKEKEQRQLRQILITSSTFRIIGASTKMIEQHFDYAKPFYEYFKIIKLDGLDFEESIRFLRVIGSEKQKHKIENIIQNSPQRIETLRQLTGGVPRTLVMLYDIFIEENENAFDDLIKILDDVTPLYKDRMDNLPDVLQDIVHNIAMNWDGITTKELAKKTRLKSNSVSSQLKQLEKYHIVEFENIGRNKIYKIKERFFNIWYLMRFGRKKDRNKVEWLVKFLSSWYNRAELNVKAKSFIETINDKSLNENYVYHMCEALSYAGLDLKVEHEMKTSVKQYFKNNNSTLKNDLSKSDIEILRQAFELSDNGRKNEAIRLLEGSNKSSTTILHTIASFYHEQKEYSKAEEYYLKAIESGDSAALNNLGVLCKEQKEYLKAEEYYLKAIESGVGGALRNLGDLNSEQKEYSKAEEYYLKAIENGDSDALNNLGVLYKEQKEYSKAEEYYLKAIESGNSGALRNLGNLYSEQKEYPKAEEHYLKAIESGDSSALNSLSWFYFERAQKRDKAVSLAEQSYQNNRGFYNTHTLAVALLWKEEFKESYNKFIECLEYDNFSEYENDMILYLNLLISKEQYYKAKEFLEMPGYQLKDRYKPIWYALMSLMQEDFPNEIKKMGSELKQSVGEVLEEIVILKEKYSI